MKGCFKLVVLNYFLVQFKLCTIIVGMVSKHLRLSAKQKKSAKVNPLHKKELDRRVLEVKGDIYGILGQPDKALLTYNNVPMRLEDKKPEIVIYAASPENAVFRVFPASQ